MMTLRQLEAFYWAATLGSFSGAAGRLHTTQSTISKRIFELEQSLGVAVFDRSKRLARLTLKGQELVELSKSMLALERRVASISGEPLSFTGNFRFGVTELIALTWLPDLVVEVTKTYPKIILEPEVDQALNLYGGLAARRIDLVIAPKPPEDANFTAVPLRSMEHVWMCSPALYPKDTRLPLGDLARLPFLAHTERSGGHQLVLRWLRDQGVSLSRVMACSSLMAIAELAAAGFGITYLPKDYFLPEVRNGRLRIVRTVPPLPKLPYFAVRRRDDLNPLSAVVAGMAKKCCDFRRKRR